MDKDTKKIAPTTLAPTIAPTTNAPTTPANTTAANTTAANTTAANTTAADTTAADTTAAIGGFTNTEYFKFNLDPERIYNNELLNDTEKRNRINVILTILSIGALLVLIGSKHELNAQEHHWDTLFYISLVILNLALFIKLNIFKFNTDNDKITNQIGNILGGISGGISLISLLGIGYYYAL